jgi:transposase-like protein
MPIIQGKILEGSTIHTDGWKAYEGLILNGYDHYRVFHSHNEFARGEVTPLVRTKVFENNERALTYG